jgi:hypothetical protein
MKEVKPSSKYILGLLKRFPKTPSLTLAKKAYKEEPKLFENIEAARSIIRMYRGTIGGENRNKIVNNEFYAKPKANTNPFSLPKSYSEERIRWHLPKSIKKVLLISDLHIPYHDINAITTAIKEGQNEKVDAVFINGDLLDFYQLSFHEKDPRKRSIGDELADGREFFKALRGAFPKANIYFIPANHEIRLERYLKVKAPELLDVEEFRLDVLLRVAEYGVEYIPYGSKCYFGKLLVEHGDKIKGAGGVNPARTLYLRLKRHAICGHFHRSTESTEKVYDGEVYVTYSTGALCHDDKTEVLTERGFVLFDKLLKSDNIAEYNPNSRKIEYKKPIAYQKYKYDGDMLLFESRRVSQLVTPEHKMLSNRSDYGNYITPAIKLYEMGKRMNIYTAGFIGGDINMDRYLLGELFGFIITDGSYRNNSNGVRLYQKTKYDRVKSILNSLNIEHSVCFPKSGVPVFNIPAKSKYATLIRSINPKKDEISRELLNSEYCFLLGLYEGLIGGDGHRRKDNKKTDYFSTHNKNTTIQFQELCCKIGFSCIIKRYEGVGNNKTDKYWYMYKCYVRKRDVSTIEKKQKIKYSGFVYDITTTNGFFVVKRDDKVSISGNCELEPGYMEVNNHNHGFAIITMDGDKFTVSNRKIVDGKVY